MADRKEQSSTSIPVVKVPVWCMVLLIYKSYILISNHKLHVLELAITALTFWERLNWFNQGRQPWETQMKTPTVFSFCFLDYYSCQDCQLPSIKATKGQANWNPICVNWLTSDCGVMWMNSTWHGQLGSSWAYLCRFLQISNNLRRCTAKKNQNISMLSSYFTPILDLKLFLSLKQEADK